MKKQSKNNSSMKITVGKAEDNSFVIKDPEVSRYHAALMQDESGDLLLEDLDSTNGTFVNDNQIIKKKVQAEDKITFGTSFTMYVAELLKSDNDYCKEFALLKDVYDNYMKEKIHIQSNNQFKTRLFQSLPFAMIGIFGILMSILGKTNNSLLVVSFIIAICAPTLGIYFGARQAAKIPELLQNLANQFKIDYVCPKCHTFLGEIPWESLQNKKVCPINSCKAKWIRT